LRGGRPWPSPGEFFSRNYESGRASFDRLVYKIVSVEFLATDGEKNFPRPDGARIDGVTRGDCVTREIRRQRIFRNRQILRDPPERELHAPVPRFGQS
jgi:hypothetical protein